MNHKAFIQALIIGVPTGSQCMQPEYKPLTPCLVTNYTETIVQMRLIQNSTDNNQKKTCPPIDLALNKDQSVLITPQLPYLILVNGIVQPFLKDIYNYPCVHLSQDSIHNKRTHESIDKQIPQEEITFSNPNRFALALRNSFIKEVRSVP